VEDNPDALSMVAAEALPGKFCAVVQPAKRMILKTRIKNSPAAWRFARELRRVIGRKVAN
jgi:hypothetical protein